MHSVKYLDLVQCNIEEFNKQQKEKQKEYESKNGKNKLYEILYGKTHHELKASRTVDYSLNETEMKELLTQGILFKETPKEKSFARNYLELYNNDLPVLVTSDSILHPFHKFYDNFLKELEQKEMIEKLKTICKTLLNNLYTINYNEKNRKMLELFELIFVVPHLLLKMNNELTSDNCCLNNKLEEMSQELRNELLNYKESFELRKKERSEGYDSEKCYEEVYKASYKNKEKYFKKINRLPDDFELEKILRYSPKFATLFSKFNMPNLNEPLELRYLNPKVLDEILMSIANFSPMKLSFNSIEFDIDGSLFKPRGHYTDSLALKQYFMAFTWLSKFQVNFKDSVEKCLDQLLLSCCLSKISEAAFDLIKEFEDFIAKIIGEPDGYTLVSFLQIFNDEIPKSDLNTSINWIFLNLDHLVKHCQKVMKKTNKLTQFGDSADLYCPDNCEKTLFSFSIIGKGNQIDNLVIQKMVDKHFVDDDGKVPLRKFTSVMDLAYLLFNNKEMRPILNDRMKNISLQGRDGFQCHKHLDNISKEMESVVFSNTIYAQELKMLRALSYDRELMKTKGFYPFNSSHWMKKQAQTQIAHYAELRHDNVLYLEELGGMMCCACEYPDLLIEPVPTFWKEFLVLINMMKKLSKEENTILNEFSTIISKFVQYLDDLLEYKKIDPKLEEELKTIIHEVYRGSGGPDYYGWYMKLYSTEKEAFEFKPEVASMFSSPNDDRGKGGVVQLGTGPVQIMYLLVKDYLTGENKVMLGPVYSAYEVVTDVGVRFNDDEWKQEYKKHKKLTF